MRQLLRWISEVPRILSVLSFSRGVVPLMAVRFGRKSTAQVRLRGRGKLTLVNRLSAMVFLNIWVREEYPMPVEQDVVLDLGANVGMFTTFALSHGATFCHCVEPCPASVALLEKHIRDFGFQERTRIMPKAVGETDGSGFVPSTSNVNNRVSREEKSGLVAVEVADVATLMDSLSPAPTYVKFDIESNEVPVLRRLLTSSAIADVHTIAVEATHDADTIASLLRHSGFTVATGHASTITLGTRRV